MAASVATPVRFSNPKVAESASAQQFPWERGVPVNAFWDGIDWVPCTHFLGNFTQDELARLPIDPASTASTTDKMHLLLSLLDAKLAADEAAAAPTPLAEAQPATWCRLMHARYVLQSRLGLVSEAGQSIRLLAAQTGQGQAGWTMHDMGEQLVAEGDHVAAEKLLVPNVEKCDAYMGTKASPQSIGARRSLLKAIWGQGPARRDDAKKMVAEIQECIQGMKGTKFEVYVEDEEEELDSVLAGLAK